MVLPKDVYLRDEAATVAFGAELARWLYSDEGCQGRALVFLRGHLGAGKTTLVRGILRALGFTGAVKSPTYTLLEPYEDHGLNHFDLYRIGDSEELDFIGMDELLEQPVVSLIEWPEQGAGRLPAPDLEILLSSEGEGRRVQLRGGVA